MGKKKTTEQFVQEARDIHSDRYDYSSTVYTTTHADVKIRCSIHGIFETSAYSHVNRKSGCPHCAHRARLTIEEFTQRANAIHNFYDYSKTIYTNISTKIMIGCPHHGVFKQTPRAHLIQQQGCPKCVPIKLIQAGRERAKTSEKFIAEAKTIHGDKYNYSHVEYFTTHTKVHIICPVHGAFFQTPNAHVSAKQGCRQCWRNRRHKNIGGYTLERLNSDAHLAKCPATLYVVEFTGDREHFYKVGITRNSPARRFYISNKKGMKVNILQQHYMSLLDAYNTERRILTDLKEYQYWPNTRIGGFTECFKPKQEVLALIVERVNKTI